MNVKSMMIAHIEPNNYNPNVLQGEKYDALKRDVKAGNYDPILVSPKAIFYGKHFTGEAGEKGYVIVDGEWRWRAAVELGLITIECEVRDIPLARAKIITYKKNRQRGNMDPFKEAKLFETEVKAGLTEEKVAERFGVLRSYVAGRRMLLKVSPEAMELYRDPEKLKERMEREIREDVAERRKQPQYIEVTDEEAEAHIQEQVAEIVLCGTLTPGHLKALAALPAEQQNEIAEGVVHEGVNVRQTEFRVKQAQKKLEREKKFQEALDKARQKTCPYCGAEPSGFSYNNTRRFACSKCYSTWDYMVTKAELAAEKKEQQKSVKTDRSEQIKAKIKNPGYVRRNETIEVLTDEIREWVLTKVLQLRRIETIEVTGSRENGEKVHISFPGSWGNGLSFYIGKKDKDEHWYSWQRKFAIMMEAKHYKTLEAKTKIDLHMGISPERRVTVHRFFDEVVKTDEDPFLPDDKKIVRKLLAQYGEETKTKEE